jgi:TolB-like protein
MSQVTEVVWLFARLLQTRELLTTISLMKIGISRAIVLFFLMFSASFAQNLSSTPEKLGIAVLDFESGVLVPTENQVLSEKFRGELLSSGKFRVMERGQMDAILREQGFQQSGACTSQECIVQMGQLLGVDKMIAGTIGKLGDTYLVSARIIDLQTGQIEKMVSEECACRLEKLLPVMSTVSQKLAGLSKAPESLPPLPGPLHLH